MCVQKNGLKINRELPLPTHSDRITLADYVSDKKASRSFFQQDPPLSILQRVIIQDRTHSFFTFKDQRTEVT